MNVLDFIPYGRENAISRRELVRLTGFDDRTIRREIKRLTKEAVQIMFFHLKSRYNVNNG